MIAGVSPHLFEETDLIRSITRHDFYEFVAEFFEDFASEEFIPNWHIPYLCSILQEAAERVFRREPNPGDIVVNIPPGTTKSTVCSIMFPAWVWTRMPEAQFITSSYTNSVALDLALKCRDLVWSEKYRRCFPEIELRQDQHVKSYFRTTAGGCRYTVGVGGQVQGMHGHFLIVDDPIDPERAVSEVELKTVARWMSRTLPTRKVATYKQIAPTILVMQRLHLQDPSQLLLDRGGVQHICLPGELTEDVNPPELADQYVDGLLDPVKMPRSVLDRLLEELGEVGYTGQVLQHPIPEGGSIFKADLITIATPPTDIIWQEIIRYWDKAGTPGGGKRTAGVKMGLDRQGHYWILHVVKGQWGMEQRERHIRQTAEVDGRGVRVFVEQEPGSGGKDSAEWTVKGLAGFTAAADRVGQAEGNKIARAGPYASQVNIGNVFMVPGEWNREYLDELRVFPQGRFSDQVDGSSGAFNKLFRKKIMAGGWPK